MIPKLNTPIGSYKEEQKKKKKKGSQAKTTRPNV